MLDTVIDLSQILMLTLIATWLTAGLRDNILYPDQNETFTTEVLTLSRLKADYPAFYDQIAHRAITDRSRQMLLFRCAVGLELLVAVLLWTGVLLLMLALPGLVPEQLAKSVAILGATGFTSIWAGFLILGNHFAYWFGHEGAQNTHYQMTLWGTGILIFLSLA